MLSQLAVRCLAMPDYSGLAGAPRPGEFFALLLWLAQARIRFPRDFKQRVPELVCLSQASHLVLLPFPACAASIPRGQPLRNDALKLIVLAPLEKRLALRKGLDEEEARYRLAGRCSKAGPNRADVAIRPAD